MTPHLLNVLLLFYKKFWEICLRIKNPNETEDKKNENILSLKNPEYRPLF